MRTIQEKYNAVLAENFSKSQFVRDARLELPNLISQFNGFDDTVTILKNKGIIQEAKKDMTPEYDRPSPGYSLESLQRGVDYELEKMGVPSNETVPEQAYDKAKAKAEKNLAKDPLFYLNLLSGDSKKVNKHDKMVKVEKNNHVDTFNGMKKAQLKESIIKKAMQKGFTREQVQEAINRINAKKANSTILEGRKSKMKGGKVVTENDYETGGYVEAMGPRLEKAIKHLLQTWEEWKQGPMTQPGMIPYAKTDLVNYLSQKITEESQNIEEVQEKGEGNVEKVEYKGYTITVHRNRAGMYTAKNNSGEPYLHVPQFKTPKEAIAWDKSNIDSIEENTNFTPELNEQLFDDLEKAKEYARKESEQGYVQHVNKYPRGGYKVEDWLDGSDTVVSYENGIMLEDHTDNPSDKYVVKHSKQNNTWQVWEGDVLVTDFATKEKAQADADRRNNLQGLNENQQKAEESLTSTRVAYIAHVLEYVWKAGKGNNPIDYKDMARSTVEDLFIGRLQENIHNTVSMGGILDRRNYAREYEEDRQATLEIHNLIKSGTSKEEALEQIGEKYRLRKDYLEKKYNNWYNKQDIQRIKEAFKNIITNILTEEVITEAATGNLAKLSNDYEDFEGMQPIINSLENIVTDIESYYGKTREKIQDIFDKFKDVKNPDGLNVGPLLGPAVEAAFMKDLIPVRDKGFTKGLTLPKMPMLTTQDIQQQGLEEKQTVYTPISEGRKTKYTKRQK